MDFSNLVCVVSATLFILYVNLTEGYNHGYLRSYGILQKQEDIEKKRFLVVSTNNAWNPWSPWSVCSSSCREGIQARGRACNTGVPSDCDGQNYDVKVCSLGPCSVWNPWSPWSVCSSTCGDGLRARGRSCESGVLSDCDGPYYEKDNCTLKSCSAWTPWSSWSACSHSCGDGFQTRYRTCNTGVNSDCEGHSYDIQECNAVPCDGISSTSNPPSTGGHAGLDGVWSSWSNLTDCTQSCGNGTQHRERTCIFPNTGAHYGKNCSGSSTETLTCNPSICPVDGHWDTWSSWSTCSHPCGFAVQHRQRTCIFKEPTAKGNDCVGNFQETQDCAMKPCQVNGTWTDWNAWSSCSQTCNNGTMTRTRTCQLGPEGVPHDYNCTGDSQESKTCMILSCPVDGKWSNWGTYSSCTVSCGNGTHTRNRSCLFNDPTAPHGAACFGANSTTEPCNPGPCPVDGMWSAWSNYTACSKTCGGGIQFRSRVCVFLNGHPHGRECIGNSSSSQECHTDLCPVDGTWSAWSNYTACSKTCGGGIQFRSRQCVFLNGHPRGRECIGNSSSSQECHTHLCPVDGKWSKWGTYSSCTVSCGNGTRTRNRSCLFNDPTAPHGAACFGANSTTEPCNHGSCPVDGTWSAWSKYTLCSKTCGGGIQSRSRQCDFLNGHPHGRDCIGNSYSSQECQTELCPVDGTWSAWSNYMACSKTCGGGIQFRSRVCVFLNGYPHGRACIGNSSSSQECHTDLCPAATKSSFTCTSCGDNNPDMCEFLYEQNTVCPDPYCVNILQNTENGQRTVERKCGSLQECKTDWWQQSSQMEVCNKFNANFIFTEPFQCTYCCTTPNCNENIHPDDNTLYKEK